MSGLLIQYHQKIIFFRTRSDLKDLSGVKARQLAALTTFKSFSLGEMLSASTETKPGYYWLKQGTLTGSSEHPIPALGESWHTQQLLSAQWVAASDEVKVYFLPQIACENLGIRGLWTPSSKASEVENNGKASTTPILTQMHRFVEGDQRRKGSLSTHPMARTESSITPEITPSSQVVFPKPLKRHLLDQLHRFPFIEQQSSSDCGVACVAMIAQYWGQRIPIYQLREKANVGRSGASLRGIARCAESVGFHARPVRASLKRIMEQPHPWIAHWEGDHYIVVYQAKGSQVIVADPAVGHQRLSLKVFKAKWTGYTLLLEPTTAFKKLDIKQASLGRFLEVLLPFKAVISQVVVLSLLIQLFNVVTPLFTQIILDRVVVQKSLSTLNVFALGIIFFSLWSLLLTSARQYLLSYFSNQVDLTLISGFIRHVLLLPLSFFESRRVGDITTRVAENQKIQRFLVGQVLLAWLEFLTGFVYLGLMLYYNRTLTLFVIALIPPIILLTLGSTPIITRISRQIFNAAAEQNSALVEMVNGVASIKSAAAEQEVRWQWEDKLTRLKNAVFNGQKFGIWIQTLNGSINSIGSVLLLWIGASMVIREQLSIGQFVAFNMMIGYVINPVVSLANLWDELQEVRVSVEKLNDVFESLPEEQPHQSLLEIPTIQGEVRFENITFAYESDRDRNTLQNISFLVNPGQTIAIVGRSGSGKTTLIKLLERLYQPTQGRILVDGNDIRHVSPYALRSQLGVVPQECFLFSGTVLENITLYRLGYTLNEVIAAAKLAEAHAFIQAMPLGYNTKVGERGSTLSGGQRQRIAVARALLGDPRILILDEATSSLDTESERRFQRNLAQISCDRTTFIIAHRLSTIRNADCILVLDKGILTEQGTHEELIAKQGLYYTLAQQQLEL